MTRPLGPTERLFWKLGQAAPLTCVVVARLAGHVDSAAVRDALDAAQRVNPLLRVRVIPGPPPCYRSTGTPAIPLRVMQASTEDTWLDEMEAELDAPIPCEQGPLARVTLVQRPAAAELILTFDHLIGDGRSAARLLGDLLDHAAGRVIAAPDPDRRILRPVIESMLPPSVSGVRGAGRVLSLLLRQGPALLRPSGQLPADSQAAPSSRRSGVISAALSPAATRRLLVESRAHGTSVGAAVTAAALLSIASGVRHARGTSRPLLLGCLTAVDVRDRLTTPVGDELGLFASRIITRHRLTEDASLWSVARAVRRGVSRAVNRNDPLVVLTAQGARTSRRDAPPGELAAQTERFGRVATAVSHLGRLPLSTDYGAFRLVGLHAAAAPHLLGSGLGVVTGTVRDSLQLDVVHAKPLVATDRANQLTRDILALLTGAEASVPSAPTSGVKHPPGPNRPPRNPGHAQ